MEIVPNQIENECETNVSLFWSNNCISQVIL